MNAPLIHQLRAERAALAPAPRILPDTTDDLLDERAWAWDMAFRAAFNSDHPYATVARQGDYARRLDAIAAQRGQE